MATVLVVEDNPIARKMLRVALQTQGYVVLEAADGRSAVALMRSQRPDLVLQDLLLPDIDGFELVRQLRALPHGRDVPILAVSGLLSKLDQGRLSSSGFSDFIAKPVEPSRLLRIVQAFLREPGTAGERIGEGRTLLLVDDDPIQRKLMRLRLVELGFTVTTAADGVEALEQVRARRPHVIVSDVLMPRLDGFGLCRALRQDPELARVPVILTSSSYVEEADRRLARRVGASALVARTPDLAELVEILRTGPTAEPLAPLTPETAPPEEHVQRLVRQLELQAAGHRSLSERYALQAAELAALSGIAEVLARTPDIEGALDEILARCLEAGGVSVGALYLLEPGGALGLAAQIGFDRSAEPELETFFGQAPLLRRVIEGGAPIALSPGDLPEGVGAVLERAKAASALIVPIVSATDTLGVLVVGTRSKDVTQDDWLFFAQTVAAQIGQALALGRAFRRVAASEARYRGLFEAARDAIILTDRAGRVVDANPAAAELTGQAVAELRQARIEDRLHRVTDEEALASGGAVAEDWAVSRRDGTRRLATVSGSDLPPDLRLLVIRDVTERRRLQAHVAQGEKLAAMGSLLAGVAHELNNPLSIVLARALLLRERHGSGPVAAHAEKIAQAADRCARIVKNFLALARQRPPERQPASLNQVIREAVELLAYQLRVDDVEVTLDCADDLPTLWADPHQLHQVVINLVSNAHQAMRQTSPPRRLLLRTRHDGDRSVVRLEVADSGPGIPPEVQRRLFEPFVTTKPPGQGTGLGLSLCRGIVEGHGGTIRAESRPGQGAAFHIELPVEAPRAVESVGRAAAAEPAVRGKAILVVDDEAELAAVLADMLAADGHEVETVANGLAALEKLDRRAYDLILCDVRMPGLDGPGLYRESERRRPGLSKRFVFLTGETLGAETAEFLEQTHAVHLGKPFDLDEVRRAVQRVLSSSADP